MTGLEDAWAAVKLDKQKFESFVKASIERNASQETLTEKEKEMKAMKITKEVQRLVRASPRCSCL